MQEFNLDKSSINKYAKSQTKVRGTWIIKLIGEEYRQLEYNWRDIPKKEIKPAEKSVDYKSDPLKCLLWHMKVYGNTLVSFDPTQYMDDLKAAGYNCRIEVRPEYTEKKRTTTRGRKPKMKLNYFVEAI